MNVAMKQRLVGTLVLGALALILIPMLLDGEGVEAPPMTATIPPAPGIDTTPVPAPVRPVIRADEIAVPLIVPADSESAVAVEETGVEETAGIPAEIPQEPDPASEVAVTVDAPPPDPEQPRLDTQGLPESWSVRLGSFGDRRNAEALHERLVAAGYKAYLRSLRGGNGGLTGVYVGPLMTRGEANRLQAELVLAFELNGIVERFTVESPPAQ